MMTLTKSLIEMSLEHSAEMLTTVLANEMTLYIKTKKSHWNVSKENHFILHQLYQIHYRQIEETIDKIAERIKGLGKKTIGTMFEFSQLSLLEENPGLYSSANETILELVSDHEIIIFQLNKDIKNCYEKNSDTEISDFLTDIMQQHKNTAQILKTHIV